MRNNNMDMCEGPLFKKIVLYTIPIILTGVLQLLFNAADLIVVGRFSSIGTLAVGAVGSTGSLINLLVNAFIGLSVGTGVKTAQAIGAGEPDSIRRIIHTSIPAAAICGIILTVIGVLGSGYFLTLMGTTENLLPLATKYMQIYFCGITATLIYNFGASILRAAGDTKSPLRYLTIAGVLNVALNLIFVLFFKMDVDGVALATAISQTLSAVLVIRALILRTDACRLDLRQMRIHGRTLFEIMRIGVPAGIQSCMFSFSNVIIQSSVNSFNNDLLLAGQSASASIEGFVYVSMNAFHQTSLNFTGQNYGAKKFHRIGKILLICLVCVSILGFSLGALCYTFGEQLLSIYISDPIEANVAEAISFGLTRMLYVLLPYFLCGIMDVFSGVIRGMGVALPPMIISLIGVCVFRVGWIYTVFQIPQYHTIESIYVSYPISWCLTIIAQLVLYLITLHSAKKKLLKNASTL
ncbi:MAG: MATE family efflux transporter [Oscillospiraceae bacterium]|nr:MATE family efflux transporter [Oscillospiraceae bacterium]MBQ9938452.1 MATE family efflux transporter [Oscillospiraceae bacterium]